MICLQGDFDSYSAPRVRSLLETLELEKLPAVLVHLGSLEYIDSTALGVLVAGLKQATDHSGSLALVAPSPPVARILRITGLDKLFLIFDDEAQAGLIFGPLSPAASSSGSAAPPN